MDSLLLSGGCRLSSSVPVGAALTAPTKLLAGNEVDHCHAEHGSRCRASRFPSFSSWFMAFPSKARSTATPPPTRLHTHPADWGGTKCQCHW